MTGLLDVIRELYAAQFRAKDAESRFALRNEMFSAATYAVHCESLPGEVKREITGIMYSDMHLGMMWDTMSGDGDAHFSRKRPHDRIAYRPDGTPIEQE